MILPLIFFNLQPLCLNTTLLLKHIPKCVPPFPCLYRKTHSAMITSWVIAKSFFCYFKMYIFKFVFTFFHLLEHFGTWVQVLFWNSNHTFYLQKKLNASNIWLDQELCSHPEFSLPNTDGRTGHKIPALLFLADSLINSMTKKSNQNLSHRICWIWRFFLPNMIVEEKNVFVLKSLHYWKKLHCFVFPFLMHISNVKTIILLEMRLHSFKNTFTNNNWPSRNI